MIDVAAEKLSFRLCGKRVDFYFSSPITPHVSIIPLIHAIAMAPIVLDFVSGIHLFDEDRMPQRSYYAIFEHLS